MRIIMYMYICIAYTVVIQMSMYWGLFFPQGDPYRVMSPDATSQYRNHKYEIRYLSSMCPHYPDGTKCPVCFYVEVGQFSCCFCLVMVYSSNVNTVISCYHKPNNFCIILIIICIYLKQWYLSINLILKLVICFFLLCFLFQM